MEDLSALAQFVGGYARGIRAPVYGAGWIAAEDYDHGLSYEPGRGPAMRVTVDELAEEIGADVEFAALELGEWTQTPSGELAVKLSQYFLPRLDYVDLQFVIEALQQAAAAKREGERRRENGFLVLAGIGVMAFAMLLWGGSR